MQSNDYVPKRSIVVDGVTYINEAYTSGTSVDGAGWDYIYTTDSGAMMYNRATGRWQHFERASWAPRCLNLSLGPR